MQNSNTFSFRLHWDVDIQRLRITLALMRNYQMKYVDLGSMCMCWCGYVRAGSSGCMVKDWRLQLVPDVEVREVRSTCSFLRLVTMPLRLRAYNNTAASRTYVFRWLTQFCSSPRVIIMPSKERLVVCITIKLFSEETSHCSLCVHHLINLVVAFSIL
jgi:hypothetical protein